MLVNFCPRFQVFSKLSEQRFPSEFELRELISNRLSDSQLGKNLESIQNLENVENLENIENLENVENLESQ